MLDRNTFGLTFFLFVPASFFTCAWHTKHFDENLECSDFYNIKLSYSDNLKLIERMLIDPTIVKGKMGN